MDHIARLLPAVLSKRGLAGQAISSLAVHRAKKWIEEYLPGVAPSIRVRYIKDGVLEIACTSSVALQECKSVQEDLLGFLKKGTPDCPITSLGLRRE